MDLGLYSIEWEAAGDAGTSRALDFLLAAHEGSLGRGFVDAVTEERELPIAAATALDELKQLSDAQAAERLPKPSFVRRLFPDLADDPRLAVELDLSNDAHLGLFRAFALYSTGAVIFLRDDEQPEIEIYDSGKSFTFFADAALLEELMATAGIPADAVHRVD